MSLKALGKTLIGAWVAASLLVCIPAAHADVNFNVSSGPWEQPTSWDTGLPNTTTGAVIGNGGAATITLAGNACESLYLYNGSVNMTAGTLSGWDIVAGASGLGAFAHSGGAVTLNGTLGLGNVLAQEGDYNLSGTATLNARNENIGEFGVGIFNQDGGTNAATQWVYVGRNAGATGTYNLNTGVASSVEMFAGYSGTGLVVQSGGVNTVRAATTIGYASGGVGTYRITGGSLSTGDLIVGKDGTGTLDMANAAGQVTVTGKMSFGSSGSLKAVANSVIHFDNSAVPAGQNVGVGASLDNRSTTSTNLADLSKTQLVFEGAPNFFSTLEVSSLDLGNTPDGFAGNVVLGGLTVGGAITTGSVRLMDGFKNQDAGTIPEAIYVNNLTIGADSILDLNGLNLYYLSGAIDPRATVLGGTLLPVGQTFLPGDCNKDGYVKFADYLTLEQNFGKTGKTWADGDFTGDGAVKFADYLLLEQNFGKKASWAVPEPATLSLLALGGISLLKRRWA